MLSRFTPALPVLFLATLLWSSSIPAAQEPARFVVQLTRSADNYGHRRALLQIDKVLADLGANKLHIEVVAYEEGIHALLAENKGTSQLLTKLANAGVIFKACRISMRAWELREEEFPLEVEFVSAGAPEMVRLQMAGYRYWRP